jgi:hypothetical protein
MTVQELIDLLSNFDPTLSVVYQCYSEHDTLEAYQIEVGKLCLPRGDGWVANERPDKETQDYLIFPGN